jgi:hypothetical protein
MGGNMETQIQEGQEQSQGNGEAPNPNRGMSKKERRRVEILRERLEPRIEKLETQINEQMEKLNSLSDKREIGRDGELASKGAEEQEEALETKNNGASKSEEANPVAKANPNEDVKTQTPIEKLVGALQAAGLGSDPTALRLVAELAALDPLRRKNTDALENGNEETHSPRVSRQLETTLANKARASHLIQPSGGGIPPAPDLRAEYEKRVNELRPGDIDGLMEVKREFRKRGMEVY